MISSVTLAPMRVPTYTDKPAPRPSEPLGDRFVPGLLEDPPLPPAPPAALQVRSDVPLAAGTPARLELEVRDPACGHRITEFDIEHEKHMHLVAVSQDLQHFRHVHPTLDAASGLFHLDVNQATDDPDNQDAAHAFPSGGRWLLFAEVKPAGQEVQNHRIEVEVAGDVTPAELNPDPKRPNGTIRKFFKADGSPGVHGDDYRMTLSIEKMEHGGEGMLHLNLHVEKAHWMDHGPGQPPMLHYMAVSNLENWLGMPGHGIMVSQDARQFHHLHAGHHRDSAPTTLLMDDPGHPHPPGGGAGPDLMFMTEGLPPDGLYRFWIQMKHEGRILTVPYTFRLEPED